jgi:hypothetical protein
MPGTIYFIQNDSRLVGLKEEPYNSEELLRSLLADHVDLLAGDEISPAHPRRWLFISSEAPVFSEEDSPNCWTVDHLLLDQDGVPTLLELKRSTDTRTRREVVGQILDFAANIKASWTVELIQEWLKNTCASQGREREEALLEFIGPELDPDVFWLRVKDNLRAGRIRLLLVADGIPPGLQRVVEFLSGQMNPAEVFAIEIHRFVGNDVQALVPRVVGRSAAPQAKSQEWDWDRFSKKLQEDSSRDDVPIARHLLEWGNGHGRFIQWGQDPASGSFVPQMTHAGVNYPFFEVVTGGKVYIPFGSLMSKPPFDSLEKRMELARGLNLLPLAEEIREDQLDKYPSLSLAELGEGNKLAEFTRIFEWLVDQVRATRRGGHPAQQPASARRR